MKIGFSGAAMAAAGALASASLASPARAADGLTLSGDLAVDAIGVVSGGLEHKLRHVDVLTISLDADLEKLLHWQGGSANLTFQGASGDMPNNDVGTLQGIDNNEVGSRRGRLFEAWVQQAFGQASLKLGFQDLNGEFYATDSAGVLLAPQSGLASELAATGPGGPSTFPQTGLAARFEYDPTEHSYVRVAAYNAHVGDIGDDGGADTDFNEGVVEIAEAGWKDGHSLSAGIWRYSKKQPDLFDVDTGGNPVLRTSQGAYVMGERVFVDGGEMGRSVTGFVRAGFSDGDTGPFKGSWQLGALITHAIPGRDDSAISFGVDQAQIGEKYRAASAAAGVPLKSAETHLELTYADAIGKLTIQPDLQYIIDPGGDGSAKNALVAMIRLGIAFGGE